MTIIIFPLANLKLIFIILENDFQTEILNLHLNLDVNIRSVIFLLYRPFGSATPSIGIRAIDFFTPGVTDNTYLTSRYNLYMNQNIQAQGFTINNYISNTDNSDFNSEDELDNYISDEDFTFERYEWSNNNILDDSDWTYNSS